MIATIDAADQAGAALVVFTLRTPGGLVDSTRDIVSRMLAARTPVAVFVGPAGARAASAGFILTIAADVAAMAPGTHIGAAHPVAGNGEAMDETMSKKAAEDVAAYARDAGRRARQRNVALAEQAVNDSRAFTDQEALDAVAAAHRSGRRRRRRSAAQARWPDRSRGSTARTVTLQTRGRPHRHDRR